MHSCPGNTPVLVGVAAVTQKEADYRVALEPVALMEKALRDAAQDAGCDQLLTLADEILVPKSLWGYTDPGRLVAEALGAGSAKTVLAEFGILQQSLLSRACAQILDGEADVVMVTGGESRYRELCASKAGEEAAETLQDSVPDVVLQPEEEMWSPIESDAGLGMPVGFYAIMDSALRYKQGLTPEQHRDQMAQLYAQFSETAASNADAWVDEVVSADTIRDASAKNRMLAFPYTKYHNSQWNVDQAAGLIFCSAKKATELGIAPQKWIFPLSVAESNHMTVVASRGDLGGCPAFRIAGDTVADLTGVTLSELRFRELYSCFPFAVRAQIEEFGLQHDNPFSITGGMTFAGGPLNNFVYQATVKMAQLLRENPGETGLVTTVSGMLTKQACALWSASPPQKEWAFADVTEEVSAATDVRELIADFTGMATVAGYTVLYQGGEPWRAVAVFDLPQGKRTVAFSEDAEMMAAMMSQECCGRSYQLQQGTFSKTA